MPCQIITKSYSPDVYLLSMITHRKLETSTLEVWSNCILMCTSLVNRQAHTDLPIVARSFAVSIRPFCGKSATFLSSWCGYGAHGAAPDVGSAAVALMTILSLELVF